VLVKPCAETRVVEAPGDTVTWPVPPCSISMEQVAVDEETIAVSVVMVTEEDDVVRSLRPQSAAASVYVVPAMTAVPLPSRPSAVPTASLRACVENVVPSSEAPESTRASETDFGIVLSVQPGHTALPDVTAENGIGTAGAGPDCVLPSTVLCGIWP